MGSWMSVPNHGKRPLKASAGCGAVVIQHEIFAAHAADQLGAPNFYLRLLVSGHASISDGDAPEHGGCESWRLTDGVDVTVLIANSCGNAGIDLSEANSAKHEK